MSQANSTLSWTTYARSYDLLLAHNPFYQALHREVMQEVEAWKIAPGDLLADIGAGTGNYSLALARKFPSAHILHVDSDPGMNARAAEKQREGEVANVQIRSERTEELDWPANSLAGLISIHALYAFPQPFQVLEGMYHSLQPGRQAVLVDAGRMVHVFSWQLAIGWHLLKTYGWKRTRVIMAQGKEVRRQNALIRKRQQSGEYWLHTHAEFCAAVRAVGFRIVKSRSTFRGISDLVVVEKPG